MNETGEKPERPGSSVMNETGGARMNETDCKQALSRLHEFLDGELTVERRLEISSHIETCGHCLELYDFEAEVKLALASRCRESLPDGVADRLSRMLGDP